MTDPASLTGSPADILTGPRPLLPDILDLHARWLGKKPAVIMGGATLSWSAMIEEANRLAHALLALDLPRNSRIAVAMQNTPETVCVLLGIAKAGHASAPLNLTVTDAALFAMIEDADAQAIFITSDQAGRFDNLPAHIHRISLGTTGQSGWIDYAGFSAGQSDAVPDVEIRPHDAFNIIYSSGTTGRPKGILHTHQTRLDWSYSIALALRYHSGCRTLCTLGLYSNISWVMLLATCLTGGTLILEDGFDPDRVLADIASLGVTHTAMVPVQFRRLVDADPDGRTDLSSMQAMMSCGSALSADLKAGIFERFPCGIIELYGLTEGVITTLDPEDAEHRLASVGKPMIGTDILILDEANQPCPPGMPGEILSRGAIVMPGYLNRPDANRETTWRDDQGRTWLRTGDIGKFDEAGFLYIVDRKKDMIISGGQNIYPADIETVLLEHPAVSAAAVIGRPHPEWGETPVAVVEVDPHGKNTPQVLLDWANARLGKRQRLRDLVFTDALPRNANGKILKRQLRDRAVQDG